MFKKIEIWILYDYKKNQYTSYLNNSLIKEDVRTITGGQSEILPNGDLFIFEGNYARKLYFNANGSLRWSFINRAGDGKVHTVGWSRILYNDEDIKIVNNFLLSRGKCND